MLLPTTGQENQGKHLFEGEEDGGYLDVCDPDLTRQVYIWNKSCPLDWLDTKEQRIADGKTLPIDFTKLQEQLDLEACLLASNVQPVAMLTVEENHQRHYHKDPATGSTENYESVQAKHRHTAFKGRNKTTGKGFRSGPVRPLLSIQFKSF